jgi:hypothetical protein
MNSFDLLSLHTDDLRYDKFKDAPDIFFNQKLKQWIVLDPALVVELLQDERLVVPNTIEAIERLEIRFKRQFPNLLFAARCIPLLVEGPAHREIRRDLADLMTPGRARTTAVLPELMERHIHPIDGQTSTEWMAGCLAPLVKDVVLAMCNCPKPLPFPRLVLTKVFDRFASLAALDAAESQIGHLREELRKTAPDSDEEVTVPLFVLGRDSLLGALGTSLFSILRRNIGRPFADIEFPDFPPETGVAIAERIAERDVEVGSTKIATGEKIRMFFQPISKANGTVSRQALFGAGRHSCTGRPVSIDVWLALGKTIRSFSRRLTSLSCELENNNIFVVPRHLKTEQDR